MLDVTCCVHLHSLLHVVAQSFKPVKLYPSHHALAACPNMVGNCCIRLHTTANTDATTLNIVGPTMLGVVASVCTCFLERKIERNSDTYITYHILICDSSLEPVLVVVRLAQNGCLLDYLRKSRENLYINVEKSKINFELSDRVGIARDIANGMLHLSNKKVRCI